MKNCLESMNDGKIYSAELIEGDNHFLIFAMMNLFSKIKVTASVLKKMKEEFCLKIIFSEYSVFISL